MPSHRLHRSPWIALEELELQTNWNVCPYTADRRMNRYNHFGKLVVLIDASIPYSLAVKHLGLYLIKMGGQSSKREVQECS